MHIARKAWPAVISIALLGWLIWRVEPERLAAAAVELPLPTLMAVTALLVLTLYFWEAVCFRVLFGVAERPLTYGAALRVRGLSYLAGVVNYEAGQALAAWHIARRQQTTLLSALSRTVLMAHHDLVVLFAMASIGATLSSDPQAVRLRPYCWTGLAVVVGLAVVPAFLPGPWRARFRASRWGAWLDSWSWGRSARLVGVRTVYFALFVVYGAIALRLCEMPLELARVVGTIPLVLLADALPSASGLGTRDTALQLLLRPQRPDALLAMSLVWSSGLLMGRFCIGVVVLWWTRNETAARQDLAETT